MPHFGFGDPQILWASDNQSVCAFVWVVIQLATFFFFFLLKLSLAPAGRRRSSRFRHSSRNLRLEAFKQACSQGVRVGYKVLLTD